MYFLYIRVSVFGAVISTYTKIVLLLGLKINIITVLFLLFPGGKLIALGQDGKESEEQNQNQ